MTLSSNELPPDVTAIWNKYQQVLRLEENFYFFILHHFLEPSGGNFLSTNEPIPVVDTEFIDSSFFPGLKKIHPVQKPDRQATPSLIKVDCCAILSQSRIGI
ncbi:hypothetical protein CEXT_688971 [Caerostris extrusa]|uniref:Uncharacterized protein n=1 Tax=Caerostris extrusa TaxID=172846 RepID=A0AAV4R166_CAEEX|nr:hypothetical protein CEXT_688971 [Caerostris extrusa]